jgi:glutamyl-Q tRNA(Asp) synthetase
MIDSSGTTPSSPYRGRFAPTPSGPLHFGSLVAAVGSFLQARSRGGEWLVRIEDLDPPRAVAGAADHILRTLEAYGLEWDGEAVRQSARFEAYAEALRELERNDLVYPCACSRRDLILLPDGRRVYPGTCRVGLRPGAAPRSVRVRCEAGRIGFTDGLQGQVSQDLAREQGDFVVRRADGLYAYHLAVVVDDAEQGITEVVRGSDLLDCTPSQIHLQRLLGLTVPGYLHLPVAVDATGQKLSKQSHAPPIDPRDPLPALMRSLEFLGQRPPADLPGSGLEAVLSWAVRHWSSAALRGVRRRVENRRAAGTAEDV